MFCFFYMNQKTIIHFRKLSENKIESFPRSPPTDVIIEYSSCPVCCDLRYDEFFLISNMLKTFLIIIHNKTFYE